MIDPVELHCCGGFVVAQLYGIARETADVDYLALIPQDLHRNLREIAGAGSALHKRHKVFLDAVTVVIPPKDYTERLIPLFPNTWKHIKLYGLEAHDLALTKLERNFERDRDDVMRLAGAGLINPTTLAFRYQDELRPDLMSRIESHDLTLKLWIQSYWPQPQ